MSAPQNDKEQVSSAEDEKASLNAAQTDDLVQDESINNESVTEENLADLLSQAQQKIADYHDQLLRAHAEVENIRRRAADDVAKARKFGTESFAESLIPVRDSLEAALAQENQSASDWQQGVESTLRQLNTAFERNQMVEIAPVAGEAFDPHKHQAISTIPSEHPKDTIAQTLQKGYLLSERVLRPALVMVSSGPA